MDTKLKKFNDNMAVRALAFIMCVMMFVATLIGVTATIVEIDKAGIDFTFDEIIANKNYLESSDLQQEFDNQSNKLLQLISQYKSEAYIKNGKLLDENEGVLYSAILDLYYDRLYIGEKQLTANQLNISSDVVKENGKNIPVMLINEVQYPIEKRKQANDVYDDLDYEEVKDYAENYVAYEADIDNQDIRKAFIEANKEQVTEIKSVLIKDQLRSFNNLKDKLNSNKGMMYFVTDGNNSYTNMKLTESSENKFAVPDSKELKKYPAYMIYSNGNLSKMPESINSNTSWVRNIDESIEDTLFTAYNDDLKVYLAFNQEYINEKQEAYQDTSTITQLIAATACSAVLCLIFFIYLTAVTGRKDEEGNYKLYSSDKMWTEIQLAFILATLGIGLGIGDFAHYELPCPSSIADIEVIFLAIICGATASVGLWFILSCIRLLKARCFIKNSLSYKLWNLVIFKTCGKIWRKLWSSLKDIYNGSSLMKKIVLCTLGVCVLSATVFLAPLVFLIIVVFAPKWVKKFEGIEKGVEEVKNGNLTYKIPVEGKGELDMLAQSINEISESSNIAVQNELKNQRMKTDLISNVSHDLKTPLTSMVTYIDLLKTEGLDSENAPEYLRILDEKTERLRHLTEDLFEAAKASSGAMPVQLEKVELLSLINQGLGEMDKKIQLSGLEFIINAEKDKYYVMADGKLLWRVVENLLGNVLKYALENSRVYIDIKEHVPCCDSAKNTKSEGTFANTKRSLSLVTLEMKNISKNALNISAEELMERFKRGDESRTTEGSGLGLAIAKDLTKLQNGWFEVFIDGDLFKAQVMLNKYEEA